LTIANCQYYDANGDCGHCYYGYKLNDGKCKKLSPNCDDMEWDKSYDEAGIF